MIAKANETDIMQTQELCGLVGNMLSAVLSA